MGFDIFLSEPVTSYKKYVQNHSIVPAHLFLVCFWETKLHVPNSLFTRCLLAEVLSTRSTHGDHLEQRDRCWPRRLLPAWCGSLSTRRPEFCCACTTIERDPKSGQVPHGCSPATFPPRAHHLLPLFFLPFPSLPLCVFPPLIRKLL